MLNAATIKGPVSKTALWLVALIMLGACGGGGGGGGGEPPPDETADYTLSLDNDAFGTLTITELSSGDRVNCAPGGQCRYSYPENTRITISAQPQPRYQLADWVGDCDGNGDCSLTLDTDKQVSSRYAYLPTAERACTPPTPTPAIPDISWQPVVSGLSNPIAMAHPEDASDRLLIAEQAGSVRSISNGVLDAQIFLDISDRVYASGGSSLDNLSGLTDIALHPQFASNGLFYLAYVSTQNVTAETPAPRCQTSSLCIIIAEFDSSEITNGTPSAQAERILLDIPMTTATHLTAQLSFGPQADPLLYISVADGGDANSASNTSLLTGKLLRIDVNAAQPYAIPADNPGLLANPFSNDSSRINNRREIIADGFSLPWGLSFDEASGQFYLADNYGGTQEINRINSGLHYGYPTCVTDYAIDTAECAEYDGSASNPPNGGGVSNYFHTLPLLILTQGDTVGGRVYRGSQYADLCGTYLYGDASNGTINGLRMVNGTIVEQKMLAGISGLIGFGIDQDLAVYALSRSGGALYRLSVP